MKKTFTYPYVVPDEPGRWSALALAAAMHAALFAFLWIGIRWQNEPPVAIEAEVWSPDVREAAPRPQPEPVVVPKPVVEPPPVVKEIPKPQVVEPPVPKPDIALEQEKKRKEQQKQRELQAEQERKDKLKAEEKQQAEQEAQDKKKLEAVKKAEADAKKKQAADAAADQKRRDEDMKRMLGQAAGTGAATSTGTAAQSQGPRGDPSYAQKVGAKIKSNINFNVPEGLSGNPAVEYEVSLLPDGSVGGMRKTKSSGVPGFDDAVARAIEKSEPYPRDKSGKVPPSFIGIHRPKDQQS